MSDTPPGQFLTRNWEIGLPIAVVVGLGFANGVAVGGRARWWARLGRGVVAVAVTGLFVVLPVTAVWHAATAQGWTTTLAARTMVAVIAVVAAVAIAACALRIGRRHDLSGLFIPTVLAMGFVATGSGLVPLLGAALIELAPVRRSAPSHDRRQRDHAVVR